MASSRRRNRGSDSSWSRLVPAIRRNTGIQCTHSHITSFVSPPPPLPFKTEENEVRTMVDPNSKNDSKLQELMKVRVRSGCKGSQSRRPSLINDDVLLRCSSTGSTTCSSVRGSSLRTWQRICTMDKFCRSSSVRIFRNPAAKLR